MNDNADSAGHATSGDPSEESGEQKPGAAPARTSPTVVGIGASAGGLRALRTFFGAVPANTGLTFAVVIHLSPEHESSLAELLQAAGTIPVLQVSGRTEMQPDCVYVIPPNKNLQIADGHLDLSEFEEPRGRRAPIDYFFRTLAEKHPDGIAILLSGGGSDGTIGMKAVKEKGGVLMVQLPEEAEHDQMPRSAIATGLVDFVLPAEELAAKLVEIRDIEPSLVIPEAPEELPEDEEQTLRKILTEVRSRTGHDFSGYRRSTLLRRIARRLRVTAQRDLQSYLGFLGRSSTEAHALLKDFLISVTNFFRDEAAFDALAEHVVPKLFDGKDPQDAVRIWVPGCATGEEAYSIAMLLLEQSEKVEAAPRIQLFATDVDEEALGYAREGRYPDAIAAYVSEERLQRFFTQQGAHYRVRSELRDRVLFAAHDMLRDPPFAKLDLVSCRNLLIYLERDLQTKILEVFHYALRPEGYLFLGSSEGKADGAGLFSPVDKEHRIYKRKPVPSGGAIPLADLPPQVPPRRPQSAPRRSARVKQREDVSDLALHRKALEVHGPPSVLVDADHTIVHLSETAGRYLHLPGGSATLSIVRVIRDELRIDVRTALHHALETGESTISGPVPVEIDGQRLPVQVHVRPVLRTDAPPLVLVLFLEGNAAEAEGERAEGDLDVSDARIGQLQDELAQTKYSLQTTIEESETQQEELRASNEELLSINEEYKSTLEELETSKEELQSVNEELETVNEELKNKVEALSRANNDLKNLMAATEVATLFLDRSLRIGRFTPALTKVFNVMPVDEGRPLSHVTHRLNYENIRQDAERVLDTLESFEREVTDDEGRHYLLRITPYRTTEDRIGGVVLTLVDVTGLKTAEEEQHRIRQRYELLLRSVKEYAIFTIDTDGRITSWNTGAARLFGYPDDEVLNESFSLIFTEEDRAAGVPEEEMETAKRRGQALDERWHVRKGGGRFWGSGTVETLLDKSGTFQGFAKVLRDDTQRREAARALQQSRDRLERLNEELEERVEERTMELREAHNRLRQLASELVKAEQRERHRIAHVLHDDLQQRLYGIQMKTSMLRKAVEAGERDKVHDHASSVEKWLVETIAQTRELALDLSPPILRNEGMTEAVGWLASQMKDRYGLVVDVHAEASFYMSDEGLRTLLFQIVRELLFNVVKHAHIDHATVELEREENELVIRIHDEGAGFRAKKAVDRAESDQGFGLFNVRERLNFVGGSIELDSQPGEGTTVVVRAPLDDA